VEVERWRVACAALVGRARGELVGGALRARSNKKKKKLTGAMDSR